MQKGLLGYTDSTLLVVLEQVFYGQYLIHDTTSWWIKDDRVIEESLGIGKKISPVFLGQSYSNPRFEVLNELEAHFWVPNG
ncbi:MAG TPA: hypothetical protein VFG14_08120 [Chthoniobacteraceae bacterium]|nr:hypothetical protein [Chthoniobacteraceae bacterium]